MIIVKGRVQNQSGLTSRLSAELVGEANHYKSNLTLICNEDSADLKSIMNVMAMIIHYNDSFEIEIEGEDEEEAASRIEEKLVELRIK